MITEKLKEVQDYFRNKIVNEELNVKSISNCFVRVEVDGLPIVIWYGVVDDPKYCQIYNGSIVLFDLSEEEQKIVHAKLKQSVQDADLQCKVEQYYALKAELGL